MSSLRQRNKPRSRSSGQHQPGHESLAFAIAELLVLGPPLFTAIAVVLLSPVVVVVAFMRWFSTVRVRDPLGWNELEQRSGQRPGRIVRAGAEAAVNPSVRTSCSAALRLEQDAAPAGLGAHGVDLAVVRSRW